MIIVLILLVLKTISIKNLLLLKTFNKNFPLQRSGLFFLNLLLNIMSNISGIGKNKRIYLSKIIQKKVKKNYYYKNFVFLEI